MNRIMNVTEAFHINDNEMILTKYFKSLGKLAGAENKAEVVESKLKLTIFTI